VLLIALPLEVAWQRLEIKESVTYSYAALVTILCLTIYARTAYDMLIVWIDHPGVYWMTQAFYDETARYVNNSPDASPVNFNMPVYEAWRETNLTRPIQREEVALRLISGTALVVPNLEEPHNLSQQNIVADLRVAFQIHEPPSQALRDLYFLTDTPEYSGHRVDPAGVRPLEVYRVSSETLAETIQMAVESEVYLAYSQSPVSIPVNVGQSLAFYGYRLHNPHAQSGELLYVTTVWQIRRPPPNIAIFLHLIEEDNRQPVTQYDGFGAIHHSLEAGDWLLQIHALPLPQVMPATDYRLQLGAYTRSDAVRLNMGVETSDSILWLQQWEPGTQP